MQSLVERHQLITTKEHTQTALAMATTIIWWFGDDNSTKNNNNNKQTNKILELFQYNKCQQQIRWFSSWTFFMQTHTHTRWDRDTHTQINKQNKESPSKQHEISLWSLSVFRFGFWRLEYNNIDKHDKQFSAVAATKKGGISLRLSAAMSDVGWLVGWFFIY